MHQLFLICVFALALMSPSVSVAAEDWTLRQSDDEHHIQIYTRDIAGSDLKEFRGEMTLHSRLRPLVALIEDNAAAPQWLYHCRALELIERQSAHEKLFYMVTDAPWPVSDRDSVFRSILTQDPASGIVTIDVQAEPDSFPPNDDFLRIRQMRGMWQFIPRADGVVKVIYQVHAEPGGGIPAWLANSVVVDNPYQTLKQMREMVRQPVYQRTEINHIKDTD